RCGGSITRGEIHDCGSTGSRATHAVPVREAGARRPCLPAGAHHSPALRPLVNAPVCPVDDDVATAVPMEVRSGAQPAGALLLASQSTSASGALAEPESGEGDS